MVSHRSLEATVQDTQILRGARTDVSGMVTSTSWLLRAGSTSLTLDVEVSNMLAVCRASASVNRDVLPRIAVLVHLLTETSYPGLPC